MSVRLLTGDCREQLTTLADQSVHCCVTSPPYWGLRDYDADGQRGHERTPEEYVANLVKDFREVRRVLRSDGTLWLNIGDTYASGSKWGGSTGGKAARGLHGSKGGGRLKNDPGVPDKNLIGIPWMLAFALRADGWFLRQDIIWHKPNAMPEPTKDRCTASHEYLFLLTRSPRYHYDSEAIAEAAVSDHPSGNGFKRDSRLTYRNSDGTSRGNDEVWDDIGGTRNKRSVWSVPVRPCREAHFATFPPALVEPCILAGCPEGGVVLDPFFGAGTTGLVADRLQRNCIGIDLNPKYVAMAERRLRADAELFAEIAA